jgi:hypothetical protein
MMNENTILQIRCCRCSAPTGAFYVSDVNYDVRDDPELKLFMVGIYCDLCIEAKVNAEVNTTTN